MTKASFVNRAAFGRLSPWVVAAIAFAGAASAQTANTRSFVSGLGVDNSNCLMATRPCRTFAYAMNQTATGGVIVALDAAEYGTVSITRAMTILGAGPGTAKISVPAGESGITINAPGAAVILRGLEIAGGANGIDLAGAAMLDVGNTWFVGQSNINVYLNAAAAKTTIHDCLIAASDDSVVFLTGSLVLARVVLAQNSGVGIFNRGGTLDVVDSLVSGSYEGARLAAGTTVFRNSTIANSSRIGIESDTGQTYLDRTTVTGSGLYDVQNANVQGFATTYSYGNNSFNSVDGTVTPVTPN